MDECQKKQLDISRYRYNDVCSTRASAFSQVSGYCTPTLGMYIRVAPENSTFYPYNPLTLYSPLPSFPSALGELKIDLRNGNKLAAATNDWALCTCLEIAEFN